MTVNATWRVLGLCLWGAVPAAAAEVSSEAEVPASRFRLTHRELVSARYNPIGLTLSAKLVPRWRLYESSSRWLHDNHVGVGATFSLNTATARGGVVVELKPLSFFHLNAMFQGFGSLNSLQSFRTGNVDFSDPALDANGASGQQYATTGWELSVAAVLQLHFDWFFARNVTRFVLPNIALRSGDQVYFDQSQDLLVANRSWYWVNDTEVGARLFDRFTLAARFSMNLPCSLPAGDVVPGEAAPTVCTMRLGPAFAYSFRTREVPSAPALFVTFQWWLRHPYRTGEVVSQAIPLVLAGFTMSGDLLTTKEVPGAPNDLPRDD